MTIVIKVMYLHIFYYFEYYRGNQRHIDRIPPSGNMIFEDPPSGLSIDQKASSSKSIDE